MSFRVVLIVSVVLAVFCAVFVEWPSPKFKPGDVVHSEGKLSLFTVIGYYPLPTLSTDSGRLQVIDWQYQLLIYRTQIERTIHESDLQIADPKIIAAINEKQKRHQQFIEEAIQARERGQAPPQFPPIFSDVEVPLETNGDIDR